MRLFKRTSKKSSRSASSVVTSQEDGVAAVEKGLKAVYLDGKGRLPDLDTLERTPSWRWVWIIGMGSLFCLFLSGLAWAGWWFIQGRELSQQEVFALEIDGPAQVSLGEEQVYELVWRNTGVQGLQDVEVRLNAPLDFTITQIEPAPSDSVLRVWRLGWVPGRAEGRLRIKGFFVGSLGGQSALQGLTTYRLQRDKPSLQGAVLQTVTYTGTVLAGNLLFPERVVAGEPASLRYVVANLGKQPIHNLMARVTFPAGFIPGTVATSVQVDPTERRATFPIGTLAPNTFYTAFLPGVFASGMSGDAAFQAEAGRVALDGAFLAAARSESRLAIAPGDLVLRLVANGVDTERSLEPGEPLRVTLGYQNVNDEPVRDLSLTLQLESVLNGRSTTGTSLLQWSQMDNPLGGASTTRTRIQTVVYDKSRIPAFAEIAPQSQGSVEVGWPTLAAASGTREAFIRVTAIARGSIGGEKTPRTIRSQPITLRYRTDADVVVEARYFTEEGAPLGSGPLPPVVGKTTNYRVYWQVRKTLHDLSEARVSAVLPKIVAWTGKTEAEGGVFAYDETTRTVSWSLGRVPDGVKSIEGWFELALTPQGVDVGRFASLLGETAFQAQDARLNELVTRTKPALNTDLSQDEGARGKGVVRKE